jgi:hypothetical protein
MIPVAILLSLLILMAGCASRSDHIPAHFFHQAEVKYAPKPRVVKYPPPYETTIPDQIIFMPEGWFADPAPIDYHWQYWHEPTFNEALLLEMREEKHYE